MTYLFLFMTTSVSLTACTSCYSYYIEPAISFVKKSPPPVFDRPRLAGEASGPSAAKPAPPTFEVNYPI